MNSDASLLMSLFPYIVGSALVPIFFILVVLLLKNPQQGALKGIAFITGLTTIRLLQGVVFGLILGDAVQSEADNGKGLILSSFLMIFGIVLLVSAYKKWRKPADPEAQPKWLSTVESLTPAKAFRLGAGLPLISVKLWVFTLGALGTIAEAEVGQVASIQAYLLFILLAQTLLILPVLIRLIMPVRSQSVLNELSAWLNKNNRTIIVSVSLIFGSYFLYQGVIGLLG